MPSQPPASTLSMAKKHLWSKFLPSANFLANSRRSLPPLSRQADSSPRAEEQFKSCALRVADKKGNNIDVGPKWNFSCSCVILNGCEGSKIVFKIDASTLLSMTRRAGSMLYCCLKKWANGRYLWSDFYYRRTFALTKQPYNSRWYIHTIIWK